MQIGYVQIRRLAIGAAVLVLPVALVACPWLVTGIFSSSYLPHGFCFRWDARLIWLHVISDALIWLSYSALAVLLARLVIANRREIPFFEIPLLFGAFIVACGFTHLLGIVVLWKPLYWLDGDVKLLTATISVITALALPFYLPRIKSTLRKAALSAENERRFLGAMESTPDSFFILESVRDTSGEILDFCHVFVNGHAAKLVNREPEAILGRSICEVVPENRTSGLLDRYKKVVETGQPLMLEFALDTFDNVNAAWLSIQAVKLDDGVAVTCSDISERKRRERVSAENERRLMAAAEANLDSFCILDSVRDASGAIADFRFSFVNTIGARLISREPSEVTGHLLSVLIPENRPAGLFDQYTRVIETGEPWIDEFAIGFDKVKASWVKCQVVKLDDGVAITTTDVSERKNREEALAENERRFVAVAESSLDGVFLLKSVRDASGAIADFCFTFVNGVGALQVSHDAQSLMGRMLCEVLPANRSSGLFDEYKRVVETGTPFATQFQVVGFNGVAAEWMKLQTVRLDDGFVLTVSDISDIKRLEMERSSAFASSLIQSSPAAVIVTGVDHMITAINPAAEKMLWYKPEELIGRATPLIFYAPEEVEDLMRRLAAEGSEAISMDQAVMSGQGLRRVEFEAEWTFLRKAGSTLSVQVTVTPLESDKGEATGFMVTAYDISERKRREEYISHLAHHDVLTGLPTRQLLMDRLEMMLSRSRRYGTHAALLMIDLNSFKQVNDTLGHHVGDRLLVHVAECLRSAVRAVDTVARMGGDEFVVLAGDLQTVASAERVAEKLLAAMEGFFSVSDQHRIEVSASIGICVYPGGGDDAATLLRNADIAMYHAKATRRHTYQTFTEKIAELVLQKREMEAALAGALAAGELLLHYQPQFSLADNSVVALEALLRWNSRKFGNVSPATFIPVAEDVGLILPIGAWVIQSACAELVRMQEQFGPKLVMAVNLSARQLDQPDLLRVIEQALSTNGLDPACLEIEITESLLMSDSPAANTFFEGLGQLGVRVAVDDFGTGFSSMSYLLRFSVDRLKIDRCFIQNSPTDPNSSAVTSAIIALAHQLKVKVVAEGVESEQQMAFLRSAGCDDVQGFLLCRPLPAEEVGPTLAAAASQSARQRAVSS